MSKICFDILCIIFTYDCTTVMWHMSGLSAMHTFSAILFVLQQRKRQQKLLLDMRQEVTEMLTKKRIERTAKIELLLNSDNWKL